MNDWIKSKNGPCSSFLCEHFSHEMSVSEIALQIIAKIVSWNMVIVKFQKWSIVSYVVVLPFSHGEMALIHSMLKMAQNALKEK
jgi:tRNA isopentenyl-2-thiomethyl-A-37 hydroxylase MiaE